MLVVTPFLLLSLWQIIPSAETDSLLRKKADSLYAKADRHFEQMDTSATFKNLEEALHIYRAIYDSAQQSSVLNDIGFYYYYLGNYNKSTFFFRKALVIDELQNDAKRMIGRLKNLGIVHQQQGLYVKALKYYLEALQLARQHQQEESMASIHNSIATLYRDQEQYEKSMYHQRIALTYWQSLQDSSRIAYALNNIGMAFFRQQQYDSALYHYYRALGLKKALKENLAEASTLHNIGTAYLAMDSLLKAETYLLKAIQTENKANNKQELAETYNALAELYIHRANYSKAQACLDSSRFYHLQTKARSIRLTYFQLSASLHENIDNLSQSLRYYKQWAALRDSLFNEEKLKVLKVQSDFELTEKEKEKQLADQKAVLVQSKNEQQRTVILSISVIALLLLFLAGVFWNSRRTIRQKNHQLDYANRQLDHKNKLIELQKGDIRHRTQNGLERVRLLLRSLYYELKDEASKSPIKSAEHMILALSSLEEMLYDSDDEENIVMDAYLQKMLDRLFASHVYGKQEVQYELQVDPALALNIDSVIPLASITTELVTNALKHAFSGVDSPKIWISMHKDKSQIRLTVKDNGVGLLAAVSSQGFGHQLVQRFVHHLKGSLQRRYEEGTSFTLTFEPAQLVKSNKSYESTVG